MTTHYPAKHYPEPLRRIRFYDAEKRKRLVFLTNNFELPAETIALARRFLGLPYLWGGTSSFGFDCSGFVQMLYCQRGIRIPRDAGPQSRWDSFQGVPRKKLKPGDLIFFGSSPDKVTHTGMYIGRGQFIHATTHVTPRVQISRLQEPHWAELFVAARRPK